MTSKWDFNIDLQVRDYECDMQNIVNNAVYMHYLEHARHEFFKSKGFDFADLAKQGINLVLTKVEIHYKTALKSGDQFTVYLKGKLKSPVRFECHQIIERAFDKKLVVSAHVEGTSVVHGKIMLPEEVKSIFT